jgi:hypothetical protein
MCTCCMRVLNSVYTAVYEYCVAHFADVLFLLTIPRSVESVHEFTPDSLKVFSQDQRGTQLCSSPSLPSRHDIV